MKKSIISGILILTLAVLGIYAYASYTSSNSRKRADKVLVNIMSLKLADVYNSLEVSTKNKYKNSEEFAEKFPIFDTMNPDNEKRLISKSVVKRVATYEYFLPSEDKPTVGNRITVVLSYSPFDSKIRDIKVQEDTAPVQ